MIDNITCDHLQTNSQFINDLQHFNSSDIGITFSEYVNNNLAIDVNSIFVTNFKLKESIKLVEYSKQTTNNILFDFLSESIFLNSNKMGGLYKKAFKQRLSQLIKNSKRSKRTIYKESLD